MTPLHLILWPIAIAVAGLIAVRGVDYFHARAILLLHAANYNIQPGRWWSNARIRRAIKFVMQPPASGSIEWVRMFAIDFLDVHPSKVEVSTPTPGVVRVVVRGARAMKLSRLHDALSEQMPLHVKLEVDRAR